MPFLTTTTAYQSHSLRDLNTRHALTLQFSHPKWTNKNGNHESNSAFITLPLVALAVMQSSSHASPINNQLLVENYFAVGEFFVGKHQPRNIFNMNFFENEIFFDKISPDYLQYFALSLYFCKLCMQERDNRKISYH